MIMITWGYWSDFEAQKEKEEEMEQEEEEKKGEGERDFASGKKGLIKFHSHRWEWTIQGSLQEI